MASTVRHIQTRPYSHSLVEVAMAFFYLSLFYLCSHALVAMGGINVTMADESVLLSFKSMLSSPSEELLASWNTSNNFCNWPGVVCGRKHTKRVIALRMDSFNLSGRVSPFLGNLSFLRVLDLSNNHLSDQIPSELGRLARLRVLNLSRNYLQGSIPVALAQCTNLTTLDLTSNQLEGEIPAKIGTLKKLAILAISKNGLSGQIPLSLTGLTSMQYINLGHNRFSGEIPVGLGNLSNIYHIALHDNMLSGSIPSSFGMLSRLYWLKLGFNTLTGVIPTSLWNVSALKMFSVQQNMLSGTIPPNAFNPFSHLQWIYMDTNKFHGHIPASIANASDMLYIQLNDNLFSGIIPPEIGRLKNLYFLQISANLLEAKESRDWEFITALTNCSSLKYLGLSGNKLEGVLPDSLSNLSTSLQYINTANNKISGSIPRDIGNLINLKSIILAINSLTGTLPSSLSRLKNLSRLLVFQNNIGGSVPWTIGNLTELNYLNLSMNAFSSWIPNTLGNLSKLLELSLASNNFIGPIPKGLFNIPTLSGMLDLSHNDLEGSIAQEIGNMKNLVEFHAESNKLSGEIPTTLGGCEVLQRLYLQNNILNGSIPSALSRLKGLEILDLSSNNLSGQIPKILGELPTLYYLNLSFNSFAGEVPNVGIFANRTAISIQGNGKLCGGILDLNLPPCSSQLAKKKYKFPLAPVLGSLIASSFVLMLLYKLLTWNKKRKVNISSAASMKGYQLISYSQLAKATDGFSTNNFLGSGSFGSVYKGELEIHAGERNTCLVAVKVLKLQTPKAHESFVSECEALRIVRHRNLIKIVTVCSSIDTGGNDFKAIVYDFMKNGSLEGWLHPDTNVQVEQKHLNLHQRVAILLNVAYALNYLHCHGPTPIAHCDVKSSNVLLDADMVAHVGDFGLARILVDHGSFFEQSTSSMGFSGTIGYAAPEYGAGNMVSTYGDIYSYGILILETISGKRPTDGGLRQGLSLREYVQLGLQDGVVDIADMRLSLNLQNGLHTRSDYLYKRKIDCLASLFRLGMSCSEELPSKRTPTIDIIKELYSIKESLEGIKNVNGATP
ncbi:unnamed protein product [Urochloa decumbens]|uniref:Receptor kinase-like protein Xa21 n=1 Tax=Urochloa decumbens TaxID=240449 RepID=A0ABC9G8A0_9POAL